MKRLTTSFETHQYEFAHGKRPNGGAGWAFEIDLSVAHVQRLWDRVAQLNSLSPGVHLSVSRSAEKPAHAQIWTGGRKYGEAKTAVRRLLEDVCYDVPAGSTIHVEVCS